MKVGWRGLLYRKKSRRRLAYLLLLTLALTLILLFPEKKAYAKKTYSTRTFALLTATPIPSPSPTPIPTPTRLPIMRPVIHLAPQPTAIPSLLSAGEYEPYFDQYGNLYNVNKELLKHIANCESHFHPDSVNGIYAGMFQFAPGTWASTRKDMGEDGNPVLRFNPIEAIKTAAFKIGHGGIGAWIACL